MQFATSNRAIERFNAQNQIADRSAAAEEQSFEKRRQREQAAGVDKAVREGIASFYPQAPVVQAPAAAPAVPAAPAAGPAMPAFPNVDQADAMIAPTMAAGFPETAAPAAAQAPVATVQPAAPPSSGGADMIRRIAATPGAGNVVMQMHNQEQQRGQQNTRLRQAAEIQAIRALHTGQADVAVAIARQYGINFPEEVIRDQRFQSEMKWVGTLIKNNGINDDAMAAAITRNFLEARKNGVDQQTALTDAFSKVPAKQPKRSWDAVRGAWVEEPTDGHPQGRAIVPPGTPARQVGGGGKGGKGGLTATERNMQARLKLLTDAGVPEIEAKRIVGGASGKQPTARDAASIASRLMNNADEYGRPIYKNFQEALKAARDALGITSAPGGGGGRIRFDNQGNRIP